MHTALLLEPQALHRRVLRQTLLGAGVTRVLEAATAAEALQLLGAELVDLVLTPWQVPDGAGRTLVQSLRNRGRNRNVPVVVLDAGLARNQVVAAVKAGAAARLSLPTDVPTVRALLERLAGEDGAPALAGSEPASPHQVKR